MAARRRRSVYASRAALGGSVVALLLLLAAAMALASGDGSVLKALVAVWLAALPALGLGALGGWLAGRALSGVRSRGGGRA